MLEKVQEEQDKLEGEAAALKSDMADLKKVPYFATFHYKSRRSTHTSPTFGKMEMAV